MADKHIISRNERFSLENNEISFIKEMIDEKLKSNQKFDREKIYFLLKLYKKFDKA